MRRGVSIGSSRATSWICLSGVDGGLHVVASTARGGVLSRDLSFNKLDESLFL